MILKHSSKIIRPASSQVLSYHIRQRKLPHWTSYFIKYKDIINDQKGLSHFNWIVDDCNYHVLRTGCWPYIKYHCTKRKFENLSSDNSIFKFIKIVNFGIPCLAYGLGAACLISHKEVVHTREGPVTIYFLYPEDVNSKF